MKLDDGPSPGMANPIAAALARRAAEAPWQPAVVTRERGLACGELYRRASAADGLLAHAGEAVFALLEDDIDRGIALFGALSAGKAYVPLDPHLPQARLAAMVRQGSREPFLTDRRTAALARRLAGPDRLQINLQEVEESAPPGGTTQEFRPEDLAWVLFTSGSTGHPKGVLQTNRNSLAYTRQAIDSLHMRPDDRFAIASPLTSLAGVVAAQAVVASGGTLYLMEPAKSSSGEIVAWLASQRVTHLLIVPTLFRRLLHEADGQEHLRSIRFIRLTGETVTRREIELFNRFCHPDCLLSIGYAATETGIVSQAYFAHPAPLDEKRLTVGKPRQGIKIRLVDEHGRPVARNEPGEIVVKSPHLSPGYWNLPDRTGKVFKKEDDGKRSYRTGDMGILRSDGSLEHIGRKDAQVQILGQRVEIAEIEHALQSLPAVQEAAVVSPDLDAEAIRLDAFVVLDEAGGEPGDLRGALAAMVPLYMLPHTITILKEMPLTRTGKVDRPALAERGRSQTDNRALDHPARGPTETRLAEIWKDVLGLDQVHRNADFLALGGDSLRAFQMISRVRKAFQIKLSMLEVVDAFTLAELARIVDAKRAGSWPAGSSTTSRRA